MGLAEGTERGNKGRRYPADAAVRTCTGIELGCSGLISHCYRLLVVSCIVLSNSISIIFTSSSQADTYSLLNSITSLSTITVGLKEVDKPPNADQLAYFSIRQDVC